MKLSNAIKKLSKFGEVKNDGNLYYAIVGGKVVEFHSNGRKADDNDIMCIRTRKFSDIDDSRSDYFAGRNFNTLAQALRHTGALA